MNELLENHVDDPIKKCVVGLSLLGFKTIFSCCGFTYKDEGVPKAHLPNKPYVYIDFASLTEPLKAHLVNIAMAADWKINFVLPYFVDFHAHGFEGGHPWGAPNAPHNYEMPVLAINRLEGVLKNHEQHFQEKVEIEDGNAKYVNEFGIKYWQYPALQSWVVTPELFNSL